jgi:hypothetical protein
MFEIGDLVKFGNPKLVAIKNREHPGKQLGIVMAVSREFFWTYEGDKDDRITVHWAPLGIQETIPDFLLEKVEEST